MKRIFFVFLTPLFLFTPPAQGRGDSLAEIIPLVKNSVVAVGTYNIKNKPRTQFYGSGVLIDSEGLIVTANHVIHALSRNMQRDFLRVFLYRDPKSKGYPVKVIAQSNRYDLALLKCEGTDFPYLETDKERQLKEGERIAFCGYPYGMILGLYPTTHQGIISSISPNILPVADTAELNAQTVRALSTKYDIYHLDAVVYPGHSGGPVFDPETGKLLGIVSSGLFKKQAQATKFKLPTGISYAIPIEHLDDLLSQSSSPEMNK